MNPKQIIDELLSAIEESIGVAGSAGAPAGVLYSAFMSTGLSLELFNKLLDILVAQGKIRKSGHLLFINK